MPTQQSSQPQPFRIDDQWVDRWLCGVVRHRIGVLACAALIVIVTGVLAGTLQKDTSANAYIEPGNPALRYRERVVETFGLKDPLVIAIRRSGESGILNEQSLRLLRLIVERLESVPNIDVDRITSLASQSAITGGADGIDVGPLLPADQIDAALIGRLRRTLDDMPIYDGTLVSKDRTATVIAAELLDEKQAAETYRAVLELANALPRQSGEEIFVAGAGAITGYFSEYIDRDAGRLVPFAAVGVTVVLFFAFLTVRSAVLPMLVAVVTLIATLGVMAVSGVPFYAITNGMVVVLIGISVAEPMHVFGEYYKLMREHPAATNQQLVVVAMSNVWRPIALTSITTAGGFLSLWLTSSMPPIRYFGLFGAFGVVVAWVLTVTCLPALMAMLSKRPSRLIHLDDAHASDKLGRWTLAVGAVVVRKPWTVLLITGALCALALVAASRVTVDHARIENFNASEPLYIADKEINRTLAGTNQLDVVIETADADGILRPEVLRRIDALQAYVRGFPSVGGITSIVDYLKQLHRAVEGGDPASFTIPDDASLISQLMLTYQAAAEPTEFQSLLDSTGRTALVRIYLRADRWSEQGKVVRALQKFIAAEFRDGSARATLTGRVMLDYEWVQSVASGHALSVIVSTITVLLMCIVIFRSIRDGLLCLAPLFVSVAGVYAVMGLADIWLGVATSMFASVAIGLGIDFAIHMVSRARKAEKFLPGSEAMILYVYRSTGRAVLFNAAAVGLGFGIVMFSAAPPIRMFGVLVATAILGAFIAAITVLPAILKLLADASMQGRKSDLSKALPGVAPLLAAALLIGILHASDANADVDTEALRVMSLLANRSDGVTADRVAHIRLIDRHGAVREQEARAIRKNVADGRRVAIFYQAPAGIRGTSFLVFDYSDAQREDDQWLYLPALRKVRRVPASDRGDYFLGTDLTYDEIRNDNRVTLSDWTFRSVAEPAADECTLVEGVVANDSVARELGYGRARWCIDLTSQIARRIDYWDRAGVHLKTIENDAVTRSDGVWSAMRVQVKNHKTGHRTEIEFREARFDHELPDFLFTQQQMERGQ